MFYYHLSNCCASGGGPGRVSMGECSRAGTCDVDGTKNKKWIIMCCRYCIKQSMQKCLLSGFLEARKGIYKILNTVLMRDRLTRLLIHNCRSVSTEFGWNRKISIDFCIKSH